ncbi:MAG: hypothetical protein RL456_249 [Pseudomonadota bacterium]|jgi:hypothetical protein
MSGTSPTPPRPTGRLSSAERTEALRIALPKTVEFLQRRRADLIDVALIDAYVSLNWLEWHGGSLRLTVTGRNVCAQLATRPTR